MLEVEPLKTDIQLADTQPDSPYVASPATEDSLSFANTVKVVSKAWSRSVGVKILSFLAVAIIALFIVFTITMSSFTAGNAICDKDLNEETEKHEECTNKVGGLDADKKDRERDLKNIDNDIMELQNDIKALELEIKNSNTNIENQTKEILELKNQQGTLTDKKNEKEGQLGRKESERTTRESELTEKQKVEGDTNKTIDDVKIKRKYLIIAAGVTGGINVINIGLVAYFRYKLQQLQKTADAAERENHSLRGKLHNMNDRIANLKSKIESLKAQKIKTNDSINACINDKDVKMNNLQTDLKDENKLRNMSKSLYSLGLDQATVEYLLPLGNITSLNNQSIYDSKKDGFDLNKLNAALNNKSSLLIIMTSTKEYVFGVYISSVYDTEKKSISDNSTFTFTTTRNKVCPVRIPGTALVISESNLLNIGDGEIVVEKSDTTTAKVTVNPGRGYNCDVRDFHPFYEEDGVFRIKDLVVHEIKIDRKP